MSKVLVVDDSLSVRKVVERALAGRQIEVVCAASGSEAIERLERDAPDVVVCDVVMPDRDGYEICEFIKRHPRLAHTPALLMDGVQWAGLADREGFVVEATANAGVDADVAAALSACLAESSDGLGRELGRGALQGVILEYEKGMVVLYGVAASGLLAVGIGEP